MNKEEILKEIEKCKEQIKNLENKLKESKVWKPKCGEEYWFISTLGVIGSSIMANDSYDYDVYSIGNCYKTKEEAEKALEIKKIDTELRRYAIEHNEEEIDWENDQQKKVIIIYFKNEIVFSHVYIWRQNLPYFTSEEIASNAVQEIGEDRIKLWCKGE